MSQNVPPLTQKAQPQAQVASANTSASDANGYTMILAVGLVIGVLALINESKVGHAVIYYGLWLMVVFLLVSQYQFIVDALQPLQPPPPAAPTFGPTKPPT